MFGKGDINRFTGMGAIAGLLLTMLSVLYSCTPENLAIPDSGDAKVILDIRTPRSKVSGLSAGNVQTSDETSISDVQILVFHDAEGSGDYTFAYTVTGSQVSQQENRSTRFEAIIRSTDFPLKLVILANSRGILKTHAPAVGQDEKSVKEALVMNFPKEGMTGNLPMYGELSMSRLDASVVNTLNVTALRAVARVDVKTRLDAGSPGFGLREVRIYRANDLLRLIPNESAMDSPVKVNTPTVPSTAKPLSQPLVKASQDASDSIEGVYLPESLSFTDSEQRRTAATTVVVVGGGGVFEGDTDVSYYRVDFNSGVAGHPFGQVLRNFLYTFTIKKVTASGWPTPEEAATNLAASMTVEVQPWEDFTSDMYFHDNYIGVSTRAVQVPFLPNYTQTVDVESSMHYSIEWVESPSAGNVSEYGVPLAYEQFTATIVHNQSENDNLTHIRIESPQYNKTDSEFTATLRLKANDTSVDIKVVKESPSRYSNRVFEIISMGTSYGSLGDYATPVSYTLAMRKVLDVNFSPTSKYPFRIGGFTYLTVPVSASIYSASVSATDVANFKKIIDPTDILILSYSTITSVEVANMLMDEWLVEKPHRVLWVMMDATTFNTGISNWFQRQGLGTWRDMGSLFDPAAGYRAASASDFAYSNAQEVQQFFSGPFGTVTEGSLLFYSDVIAGFVLLSDSAQKRITPLVYNNKAPYDNYMSVGVDTRRGVVYQGESQFFQGGLGMSGMAGNSAQVNGTIISAPQVSGTTSRYYLDVLNANIWAWAVGRVIYGPPPTDTISQARERHF